MRGRVEGARRVLIGRKDPVPEEKKKRKSKEDRIHVEKEE